MTIDPLFIRNTSATEPHTGDDTINNTVAITSQVDIITIVIP